MNVLIDIGHPAHVHLFRNLYQLLIAKGHNVILTVKNIPVVIDLLKRYNIEYILLDQKPKSFIKKAIKQFSFTGKIIEIAKKNNIDIGLGVSVSIPQAGLFTKMKTFVFDDDDITATPLFALLSHTFANKVISPDCVHKTAKYRHYITYPGYHELAYLHPNRFTPDKRILDELRVNPNENYFILRFNAFQAHHDLGKKGLSSENKRKLIKVLKEYGKVFISGEDKLEDEFTQYQINLPPEKIHSAMYYATMFISDSQTMSSEAAVLGTPAFRLNSFVGKIAYLEELENKYDLTYGFLPGQFEQMIRKIKELLNTENLKETWKNKRQKMLQDKIDVTAFMVWFVDNHPESVNIIKDNPDYQLRFK